ncbi:MAG: Lacal_2735 family protein [Oligoflexales bacterium]|nr:Lacal_2735 family protein [Oligoflexales bacterium]
MYSWLKFDEVRKLQRLYDQKFEEAIFAQRSGNIRLYGELIAESERILQQINAAKKKLV